MSRRVASRLFLARHVNSTQGTLLSLYLFRDLLDTSVRVGTGYVLLSRVQASQRKG
jgi:hypothetical protein